MLKHDAWQVRCVAFVLVFLFHGARAFAIDPFTIAAVVGTAANVVSTVSETTGEVAASTDAFSELYSEIDSDAEVGSDGQKIIREIREIEALANEVGYTKDELDQLSSDSADPAKAKKLSTVLRSITKAVRAGKRVGRLVMKLEQKAKISQVESASIAREQLMAELKRLQLDHERDLRQLKDKLLELKDKRDQIKLLREQEKKAGAKVFGKTGVLSFPRQDSVVEEALAMAIALKQPLIGFVMIVFFIRLIAYQFGMYGVARYGDLLRDTLLCALLFAVFPDIVRACLTFSDSLAQSVGQGTKSDIQPGTLEFPSTIELMAKTRIFFEWLYDWIRYIAFSTAKFLTNFGLAFFIVVFPIVIFCSQMLNFAIAWPIFLGGYIALSLWPVFWNATGLLAASLWKKDHASFNDQCATILFGLLQFFSPFIAVATLKGQPLAKAVGGAAEALKAKATGGTSFLWSAAQSGYHGTLGNKDALKSMKPSAGRTVGRVLSYGSNQIASRSVAGTMRAADALKSQLATSDDSNRATKANTRNYRKAALEGLKGFVSNQATPAKGTSSAFSHAGRTLTGLKRTKVIRSEPSPSKVEKG